MVALAVLSNFSPSPLSLELEGWGYTVYEAIEFDEILHLFEYMKPAALIVSAGIRVPELHEVAQHQEIVMTA
jgi:hypothetical protein